MNLFWDTEFCRFEPSIMRMFDDFFKRSKSLDTWAPPLEVRETKKEFIVNTELPVNNALA